MIELPEFAAEVSRRKAYKTLFPRRRRTSWLARIIRRHAKRK